MSEKTEAIVVRLADFSETSRVATLFTRDFGKISVLAKGARRLKGPFEAALDLLTVCRVVFLRKSSASLDLLTEAQLVSRFRPPSHNLSALYGGYYVAELLTAFTEDYDPHPALYDEAVRTLERLAAEPIVPWAVLRFELSALREIGQLPALETCVACGKPTDRGGPFAFWVSQGGLICPDCQKPDYQREQRLAAGTVAVLRRLAQETDDPPNHLSISPAQLKEMRYFTMAAVSHVLGRRPKMSRYFGD